MLTAETIQRAYAVMGYDAVAVSANDLSAGKIFFENSKEIEFPWISANIYDTAGKLLFKPFILKQIGETNIGVIGLSGPDKHENDKIVIRNWEEPLRLQLQSLVSRTDMIVLLTNLPSPQNNTIAETFPEVDLIFTADKNRRNLPPYIAGNALITQTQSRGKYLGKLLMQYHPGGKWSKNSHLNNPESKPLIVNSFKADFIAIKPKSPQSEEINLMVRELKKKIN